MRGKWAAHDGSEALGPRLGGWAEQKKACEHQRAQF